MIDVVPGTYRPQRTEQPCYYEVHLVRSGAEKLRKTTEPRLPKIRMTYTTPYPPCGVCGNTKGHHADIHKYGQADYLKLGAI